MGSCHGFAETDAIGTRRMARTEWKAKMIEALRWIAVLPAAVLGGLAAHLIVIVVNSPGCTRGILRPDESVLDRFFVVVTSNIAMGLATVFAGAKTAPRQRKVVAVVLAVLWVFFSGMVFTVLLQRRTGFLDYVAVIVRAIGAVVAAACIYADEPREDTEQEGGGHRR